MCVLPGQTRSSVAAVLALLIVLAPGKAFADESPGHAPFGALKREGFIGVVPPGTAEHEALFSPPAEATTDAWGTAAQASTPADDVVFAAPVLQAGQELVTGSTNRLLPPPAEPTTDAWGAAAQSSRPAADVVFAAPVFLADQETATGSIHTMPPNARPEEATTDTWGAAAQASMPAADVVFAAPVLSVAQEIVTGSTSAPLRFSRPEEAKTQDWGAAAQSSTPASDVVFAAPALPTDQQTMTGPTNTLPPLWRHGEATTDAGGASAQSTTPADDVVFAAPALPVGQETVTGPTSPLLPPPLIAATVDAVVFGPPSGGADSGSMSDRLATPSSTPGPQSGATSRPALAPEEATRLKARARGLLANGSVASARALLEQAASRGDAEGEYLLAQTYDSEALTRSGMIGVAGDAVKAEALYRAAQLGGYHQPDKNARAAQP